MPDRLSWEDYFMANAELIAKRSTCDRAFVGAVLVKNKRIIATGYNGGVSDTDNCSQVGHQMEDGHCIRTEIYVTHFPCVNCTKALLQAGVKKVTYKESYRPHPFAVSLMKQKQVTYQQHDVPHVQLGTQQMIKGADDDKG